MSQGVSKSGRIAKNTAFLYIRMMIVMIINLYAVRVVLNALGAEDYGIYNVIGGIISMMSSVTTVLAGATQRFYSYAKGENDNNSLKEIFSVSVNIYVILAILVIVIGETVGLWFVNTILVIPPERLQAANWIFQFSIFSFVFGMLKSPFFSAVIANENMGVFAVVSLIDCFLKFGAALLLMVSPIDKLIFYGSLICIISVVDFIIYFLYGKKRYEECKYVKVKNKRLYKNVFSFSGWTFLGSMANVGMNQVNTILVNIFFGPIVNAARAIALQINGALSSFCGSFIMAIRPPMIKAYAEQNYLYVNKLFSFGNKVVYYCMLVVTLPLIFEMDLILTLWLKSASEQTVLFSRLIVVYAIILSLNNPITIIMQAANKVKEYYIPVESFTLLCPIITFVLYYLGCPPESTFWAMIATISISHLVRLRCLKKYFPIIKIGEYLKSFVLPAAIITIVTTITLFFLKCIIPVGLIRVGLMFLCTIIIVLVFAILIGLNKEEKESIKIYFSQKKQKKTKYAE